MGGFPFKPALKKVPQTRTHPSHTLHAQSTPGQSYNLHTHTRTHVALRGFLFWFAGIPRLQLLHFLAKGIGLAKAPFGLCFTLFSLSVLLQSFRPPWPRPRGARRRSAAAPPWQHGGSGGAATPPAALRRCSNGRRAHNVAREK